MVLNKLSKTKHFNFKNKKNQVILILFILVRHTSQYYYNNFNYSTQCDQNVSGRLNNRQDNLPLIEESTEREPCGSRIINFKHVVN
jgi:hypothetical protein